ncbi:hypothetical protein NE236_41650 [Actinoallomurus purpureus]|uniref:hypothetical protein n=1 Tax=Actinoallomurus purpureus TaxID=478114 RepID=UPI0020936B50|nr:hypothetical protein [Actinoallomurus purpureus]MCO6011475.1 hypothetical protein [Actinoallomurus purpureus]
MTTTNEQPPTPPPDAEQQWVPAPEPATARHRSESDDNGDEDRGHPVGHWITGGTSGLGVAGAELWHAFGMAGLAVGGVVTAAPAAAYGMYKLRGDGKNRSPFGKGGRGQGLGGRRSSARMGSVGLGKGKGPKLTGGRGAKLGGGKGTPLGKGGGPKLGKGTGPKLGKAGAALGGKGAKLFGGRGSKLGGKTVGKGTAGRAGSGTTGRGNRGGAAGNAGGRSSAGGANVRTPKTRLGRAAHAVGRKAAAAAARTKTGQRVTKAVQAAKGASAGGSKSGAGRWSRWNAARRAARARLSKSNNPFVRLFAAPAAGLLALLAMFHERWKRQRAEKAEDETTEETAADPDKKPATEPEKKPEEATADKPRHCQWCGRRIDKGQDQEVVLHGLPFRVCLTCFTRRSEALRQQATPTPDSTPEPGQPIPPRRTMTNQFPLADATAQVEAAAARYWPQTMWQVDQDLEQIHLLPEALANAVQAYTKTLQAAYPLDRVVVEALFRMYTALGQVAVSCMDISKLFKDVHAEDIKRRTAPRIGEDKWNV